MVAIPWRPQKQPTAAPWRPPKTVSWILVINPIPQTHHCDTTPPTSSCTHSAPISTHWMADCFPVICRGESRNEGSHTYIPTDPKLRCNSGDTIKDFMSTFVSLYFIFILLGSLLATGNEGMNKSLCREMTSSLLSRCLQMGGWDGFVNEWV